MPEFWDFFKNRTTDSAHYYFSSHIDYHICHKLVIWMFLKFCFAFEVSNVFEVLGENQCLKLMNHNISNLG